MTAADPRVAAARARVAAAKSRMDLSVEQTKARLNPCTAAAEAVDGVRQQAGTIAAQAIDSARARPRTVAVSVGAAGLLLAGIGIVGRRGRRPPIVPAFDDAPYPGEQSDA